MLSFVLVFAFYICDISPFAIRLQNSGFVTNYFYFFGDWKGTDRKFAAAGYQA